MTCLLPALDLFKTLPMTRSPVSDVRTKIQNRIDELVSRIYRDLANPGSTKMIARRSIELLCNMNQAERV